MPRLCDSAAIRLESLWRHGQIAGLRAPPERRPMRHGGFPACSTQSSSPQDWPFLWSPRSTPTRATGCRRSVMAIDYILGGIVTVVITVYLVIALLRPERF